MLYFDTSAAVRSPSNCGIPRTMRRLYEALRKLAPVTPLVWSRHCEAYCRLSPTEQQFLEQPFARHAGPMADPCAVGTRWRYSLSRWLSHRRNALRFDQLCQPGHTLLMPDMCAADRARWLERAAADGRLRLVALFHDAIPYLRPDLAPGFRRSEFDDYLRCLSRFQEVVTISEESRAALLASWGQLGCAPAPVSVKSWPADFGPRGRADLSRLNEPRLLYVASLDPRKNHLALFEACEELWSEGVRFELELIGRQLRDRRSSQPAIEAIRRLQQAGRPVRWHGHVSDDALMAAYRNCAFTVYPSLIEGFGLPIHESLWFGRPCICGTNGALGEVSAGGGCLPCDQTRRESLAAAMKRLLTDHDLYARLAREAEERPFQTWDDYARVLCSDLGF